MTEQYTEVTKTYWGKRISGSFFGMISGFVLVAASLMLLWWNEGRSVDRMKTLDKGQSSVISVDINNIDSANAGKLIHVSGQVDSQGNVQDSIIAVSLNALKMQRTVQMYQWQETSRTETAINTGGSETQETTYEYNQKWSSDIINSEKFKQSQYQNPAYMPVKSLIDVAKNIKIGEFKLSKIFVDKLNQYYEYPVTKEIYESMSADSKGKFILDGDQLYSGQGDSSNPQIGDIKINYQIIYPYEVTLIGKQERGGIVAFQDESGSISLISEGYVGSETMFKEAAQSNNIQTWLIRIGSFILMNIAIGVILRPIRVLADVLPFLGKIIGFGTKTIALIISIILTLLTISIAWIFYRPLLAIVLIAISGAVFFWFLKKDKDSKKVSK
ncbi:MAG: hypothetical protein ACJAZX_000123 [Rickettsiales bacterium]|jgi:hypothetical protein